MAHLDHAIPRAVHAQALGIFAALMLLLMGFFLAYAEVNVWDTVKESGELRKSHYSETVYIESIFRTRANTWSNMAFVLVGLYALAMAFHDRRNATGWLHSGITATPPALTVLFGLACCYLGVGSGIFHASLTRWGQQLDVASMYPPMLALMTMLLYRNLVQRLGLKQATTQSVLSVSLIVAVAISAIIFYVYKWSMSSGTVLPAHVLGLGLLYLIDRMLWSPKGRVWWLLGSFAAVVAGTTCRQLDVAGHFSGPDAWYQGHAFWHVLCALSLGLGWWYTRDGEMRSTNAIDSDTNSTLSE